MASLVDQYLNSIQPGSASSGSLVDQTIGTNNGGSLVDQTINNINTPSQGIGSGFDGFENPYLTSSKPQTSNTYYKDPINYGDDTSWLGVKGNELQSWFNKNMGTEFDTTVVRNGKRYDIQNKTLNNRPLSEIKNDVLSAPEDPYADRTLYYLRVMNPDGTASYKVGVAHSGAWERYKNSPELYDGTVTVLMDKRINNADEYEQLIHGNEEALGYRQSDLQAPGHRQFANGGYTEIYNNDILGLDGTLDTGELKRLNLSRKQRYKELGLQKPESSYDTKNVEATYRYIEKRKELYGEGDKVANELEAEIERQNEWDSRNKENRLLNSIDAFQSAAGQLVVGTADTILDAVTPFGNNSLLDEYKTAEYQDKVWGYDRDQENYDAARAVHQWKSGDYVGSIANALTMPETVAESLPEMATMFGGVGWIAKANRLKSFVTAGKDAEKLASTLKAAGSAVPSEVNKAIKLGNRVEKLYNNLGVIAKTSGHVARNLGFYDVVANATNNDLDERIKNNNGQDVGIFDVVGSFAANTISYAIDKASFGDILKRGVIDDVKKMIGMLPEKEVVPLFQKFATTTGKAILSMGEEGSQEYVQQWFQIFSQKFGTDKFGTDMDMQENWDEALQAGILGAGAGGMMHGAIKVPKIALFTAAVPLKAMNDYRNNKRFEQDIREMPEEEYRVRQMKNGEFIRSSYETASGLNDAKNAVEKAKTVEDIYASGSHESIVTLEYIKNEMDFNQEYNDWLGERTNTEETKHEYLNEHFEEVKEDMIQQYDTGIENSINNAEYVKNEYDKGKQVRGEEPIFKKEEIPDAKKINEDFKSNKSIITRGMIGLFNKLTGRKNDVYKKINEYSNEAIKDAIKLDNNEESLFTETANKVLEDRRETSLSTEGIVEYEEGGQHSLESDSTMSLYSRDKNENFNKITRLVSQEKLSEADRKAVGSRIDALLETKQITPKQARTLHNKLDQVQIDNSVGSTVSNKQVFNDPTVITQEIVDMENRIEEINDKFAEIQNMSLEQIQEINPTEIRDLSKENLELNIAINDAKAELAELDKIWPNIKEEYKTKPEPTTREQSKPKQESKRESKPKTKQEPTEQPKQEAKTEKAEQEQTETVTDWRKNKEIKDKYEEAYNSIEDDLKSAADYVLSRPKLINEFNKITDLTENDIVKELNNQMPEKLDNGKDRTEFIWDIAYAYSDILIVINKNVEITDPKDIKSDTGVNDEMTNDTIEQNEIKYDETEFIDSDPSEDPSNEVC